MSDDAPQTEFGKSNYAAKKEEAEHLKATSITAEKMMDESKKMVMGLLKDVKSIGSNIKSAATPAIIKNVIAKFRYKKDMAAAEMSVSNVFEEIDETIKDEHKTYKRAKERAMKEKTKLKKNKAGNDKNRAVVETDAEERKKLDFTEYHERRHKQIDEREAKIAAGVLEETADDQGSQDCGGRVQQW